MLRHGADPLIWSKRGHTPLDVAKGKCQDLCLCVGTDTAVADEDRRARALTGREGVTVAGLACNGRWEVRLDGETKTIAASENYGPGGARSRGEGRRVRAEETRRPQTDGRASSWWELHLTGGGRCALGGRRRRLGCSRQTWSQHQMRRHAGSSLTRRRPVRHAGEDHAGERDRSQRTGKATTTNS